MGNVLIAVGAILMTWVIVISTLIGLGLLIQRLYGLRQISAYIVVVAFWVGFAAFLAFGQVWHLFWAADGRVWLVILPLGIAGIVWCRHALWGWLAQGVKGRIVVTILGTVLVLLSVRIALLSTLPTRVHDTGSYHLSATLWSHEYPIVPGLSNLHHRLGYNSSAFVYAASMSEGPWAGRPHHVMMGPFLIMTLVLSIIGARRVYLSRSVQTADLLSAMFIAPTVYVFDWRNQTASLSPNVIIFLLVLVGGWQAVVALTSRERAANRAQYASFCAALLLAAATTVKLTVGPFFAPAMWLLMAWWSFRCDRSVLGAARLKPLVWLVISTFLLIGPWLVRGVILSGYPFYPIPVAGLDVDWRVPEEQAKIEAEWSQSTARQSIHAPAVGLEWVGPWVKKIFRYRPKPIGPMIPTLCSIGAGLIIVIFLLKRGWPDSLRTDRRLFSVVWLVLIALVIWFATAPDPRYGIGFFWLLSSLLSAAALGLVWQWSARVVKTVVLATVLVLGLHEALQIRVELPAAVRAASLRGPGKTLSERINRGLAPVPSVELRDYVTSHGLWIKAPVIEKIATRKGNQVWGSPLLTTPHPSPNLKLRNPEDVSAGFKSEGAWRPYGYPNLVTRYHEYVERCLAENSVTQ